ncbi:hypothetical protein Rhopal_000209-T1 [Rhodotorula paludigena]|uniref:ISWI chromatin-remodeling complex ATPase ISW2 n=1 Tax=Rhodotorula paludigena TaxID=86838 RepID=A0AAV5G4D3_9BASI|nr:hypothetical protein Rhopal_000209-T1 [Rhodotorula paludigena]
MAPRASLPLKRPLEGLHRSDSLGSLNPQLDNLALSSGIPTPAATPGPVLVHSSTASTSTASLVKDEEGGPDVVQTELGRGKRTKRRYSPEIQVLTPPPPSKKLSKSEGKAKAELGGGGGPGWWFADSNEAERRRNAFIHANAAVFAPVLPSDAPTFLSKTAAATAATSNGIIHPFRNVEQPTAICSGAPGILKDYQLVGLSFLAFMAENGMNCILADEMGLGKTLQTLSLIAYLGEQHGQKGPHLLVCPLSVLGSWMSEIEKWLPSYSSIRYHGPATERARLKHEVAQKKPDLIVTTYEAFVAEASWFKQRRWGLVVLDEGHRIKNAESQAAMALQGIGARMRIILSGTPLQNNLIELWALLHFLYPQVFPHNTLKAFRDAFNLTLGMYDSAFLGKAQKLLEILMLRRTKDGVAGQLSVPPREELTLYVPLSPIQRFWYTRLLCRSDTVTLGELFGTTEFEAGAASLAQQQVADASGKKRGPAVARLARMQKALERKASFDTVASDSEGPGAPASSSGAVTEGDSQVLENIKKVMEEEKKNESGGGAYMKLMNLLIQLRKCEPEGDLTVDEHIVAASSKLIVLDKLLRDVLPKGEKVLIFSGFTKMLDILEDFCSLRSYKYCRLDGSTSRPRRALDIRLFQQTNSPLQVFLISTRAGGLGINLTAATTVVMYDQDFNPQVDIQAIARAHRIGQTKTVRVYRLVTQGSVEEQAMTRLRKKLYLSVKIMGSMRDPTQDKDLEQEDVGAAQNDDEAPRMTRGELVSILRAGTGALAAKWDKEDGDPFTAFRDTSFADLCERGRKRDEDKDAGLKRELGESITEEERARLEEEEREAEEALLAGREAISSRKFEGKLYTATNADIRKEWQEKVARESKTRTVMVDGYSVAKDTVSNKQWEAVKTISSDPKALAKLAGPKRTKRKFEHEEVCHACKDGGQVYCCAGCPRVYHAGECAGASAADLARTARTTQAAGGLLFRCQTCPVSLCEDCLPANDLEAVGDVLPEFLLLGYGRRAQAYWIRCPECVEYFAEYPEQAAIWRREQDKIDAKAKREGHVW